jgi:hypothetical protein
MQIWSNATLYGAFRTLCVKRSRLSEKPWNTFLVIPGSVERAQHSRNTLIIELQLHLCGARQVEGFYGLTVSPFYGVTLLPYKLPRRLAGLAAVAPNLLFVAASG